MYLGFLIFGSVDEYAREEVKKESLCGINRVLSFKFLPNAFHSKIKTLQTILTHLGIISIVSKGVLQ